MWLEFIVSEHYNRYFHAIYVILKKFSSYSVILCKYFLLDIKSVSIFNTDTTRIFRGSFVRVWLKVNRSTRFYYLNKVDI